MSKRRTISGSVPCRVHLHDDGQTVTFLDMSEGDSTEVRRRLLAMQVAIRAAERDAVVAWLRKHGWTGLARQVADGEHLPADPDLTEAEPDPAAARRGA